MKWIKIILGSIMHKLLNANNVYMQRKILSQCGKAGSNSVINAPYYIKGAQNIFMDENVVIGAYSTIFCTEARIIIKKKSFTGPNVTFITGSHASFPGKFLQDVYKKDIAHLVDISVYDKDIIIEEDVWIASNVVIIKGVTVGRGSIVAAGSVVVKDVPPYSLVGGNPAKFIKFIWNTDQILEHEKSIYKPEERLSRNYIESLFVKYQKS